MTKKCTSANDKIKHIIRDYTDQLCTGFGLKKRLFLSNLIGSIKKSNSSFEDTK